MYWNFENIAVRPERSRFSAEEGPIFVEIGFGNGEFLQYLSASKGDSLIIGIEVSQWCISKAARRALSNGLKNVRLLCGDARYLLRYAFERGSVTGIFMNFPCPWPKRRHSERRVTHEGFTESLSFALKQGGSFTLVTDVDWYALEARDIFENHADFKAGRVELRNDIGLGTKYGRKWLAMGRGIYAFDAVKTGATRPGPDAKYADESPDETEASMDTKLQNLRNTVSVLKGDAVEGAGFKVIFRDVFTDGENEALVRTISVDEGFEQHYYLKITQNGGRLNVKTDSTGRPYKTPGVRASVRYALERLTSPETDTL